MLSSLSKDIDINRREVYRYLGYKGEAPSDEVATKVEACIEAVKEASELRGMYEAYPVSFHGDDCFSVGDIIVKSSDLARNLRGCMDAFVMGATIGVGIDRLIARAEITDMASAAIYQAVGAAYIEDYCDHVNDEIKALAEKQGLVTRPRFSPGYGDFGLEYQREIFNLLNLPKHVGVSLSESLMMTPSKSVTAIIGVASEGAPDGSHAAGTEDSTTADAAESTAAGTAASTHNCNSCNMTNCPFREVE